MKIVLTLKQLKTTLTTLKKCYLKIHFGKVYKIQSSECMLRQGSCHLLQINTVELDTELSNINAISFDFVVDGQVVGHSTLFAQDAIGREEIVMKCTDAGDRNVYRLIYQLRMESLNGIKMEELGEEKGGSRKKLRRRKTIEQEADNIPFDDNVNIKYAQLMKLTYVFAKRLDPMVKLSNFMQSLVSWKLPEYTIGLGILLSLFVLFPKISIILACLLLIFGRNYIIKAVQTMIPKQDISNRVLPPDQNLAFLYKTMSLYCDIFEKVSQFLESDDRTKIITIIEIICKMGIFVSLFLLILPLQVLLIVGIWGILFSTSTTGKRVVSSILPMLSHYNRRLDKVIKNVSKSAIAKTLASEPTYRLLKTFYIYRYDRWWVAIKWKYQYYSNEQKTQQLQARMTPPKGYRWLEDWKVEISPNTDAEGYEYTNDLMRGRYTPDYKMLFHVLRRSKWVRTCVKVEEDRQGEGVGRRAVSEIKYD